MKFAVTRPGPDPRRNGGTMQFFSTAVTTLQTLVIALGAGLAAVSYTHLDVYKRQEYIRSDVDGFQEEWLQCRRTDQERSRCV